ETWLKEQIEETFSRVEKGEIRYYSEDEADERMNSFISKIEHHLCYMPLHILSTKSCTCIF
ncbi:hypothetical protein MJI20_30780, partial [Salmonella enterica subsp. enterica serovar Anatum]|nr:hypothetical protein [Salmonella enterica subsp. enterica serovar Anatum]